MSLSVSDTPHVDTDELELETPKAPFNHPDADIIVRSITSNVDFPVIKAFLSFASPVWHGILSIPTGKSSCPNEMSGNLHVIPFQEDADTLRILLWLCYPPLPTPPAPKIDSFEAAARVFEAARKYCVEGVERVIMEQLVQTFLETEPLRLFAFSWRFGMQDEMKMAAKNTLRTSLLEVEYIDELEWITAGAYFRLQQYHIECGKLAAARAMNMSWLSKDTFVWFECSECSKRNGATWVVTLSDNRNKWVYCHWWRRFMAGISEALKTRPSRSTVEKNLELLDETLSDAAMHCHVCRTRASKDLREFLGLLADELDNVADTVELVIPK
ncbi:hypothetical protein V5O48_005744 [Marasmius crinis-equi]|uniref:BTB domain-containing protein n=1 Tax=Marasmius crinis-equi TaxID=585013 RepID=A0ABR3FLE7_9AGAR